MYRVVCEGNESNFDNLELAMVHAKSLNKFVSIQGGAMEIVGMFGVDCVQHGVCPDGVVYDWNKSSRIGRVRKEKVT